MNQEDFITINIPLLIRLLEWAHEDCKSDIEIHDLVQNAIQLSLQSDTLSMEDYNQLLGNVEEGLSYNPQKDYNIDTRNNAITIKMPYNQSVTFRNGYYFTNGNENNFRSQTRMMALLVNDILSNPTNPQNRIHNLTSIVTKDL